MDGGAISLRHPLGTSGNRLVLHLVNALRRLRPRRGITTECTGGGLTALIDLVEAMTMMLTGNWAALFPLSTRHSIIRLGYKARELAGHRAQRSPRWTALIRARTACRKLGRSPHVVVSALPCEAEVKPESPMLPAPQP